MMFLPYLEISVKEQENRIIGRMEIEMGEEKEGGEQITFITACLEVKNSQT